jgi:hypothetical protein
MSCFSAPDSFDQLGCTADMQSDQASEHSASDATSVARPRSRSQLIASPSEGSGVQVAFPRRPWPEAAALSTWKVDPQSGADSDSDSESICTEVSASFEVVPVESGESDPLHSDRDGHLLPVALPRPTTSTTDSKLELESDSDDHSKSGAHFSPFAVLAPSPTDETDGDVHQLEDGDDQAPGRPEWEFVWA